MTSRKGFVYDTTTHADPGNVSPELSDYATVLDVGLLADGTFNDSVTGLDSNETYYYRAFGYDDVEDLYVYGDEVSFSTPPIGIITSEPATDISFSSVTLNGDVTELNSPNLVGSFKYSIVGSGVWYETDVELIGITGPFSQQVTGLQSNTDYSFMFVTTYESEELAGDILTFTTLPLADITTNTVTGITFHKALFSGTATELYAPSLVGKFRYRKVGTSTWKETPNQPIAVETITQEVFGLDALSLHEVELVVSSSGQQQVGNNITFTTEAQPPIKGSGRYGFLYDTVSRPVPVGGIETSLYAFHK